MRRDRTVRFVIHSGGLAILLSLGLIFGTVQAQASRAPVLTKKAQAELIRRGAAQKAAAKKAAAQKATAKKEEAAKAAVGKKKLLKNAAVRGNVVVQANGNIVIGGPNGKDREASGGATTVLPEPDRETIKRLMDAKFLIEKERFGEAVQILGDILSSPSDSFFSLDEDLNEDPEKEDKKIRGLHDEAEQILGSLPRQAMELYELQFGAQARQLLKKALCEGDTHGPADVSRRFFYTDAGIQATWLSGLAAMDEGRWKAAVLSFERFKKVPQFATHYEPLLSILKAICMEQTGQSKLAEKTWQALRKQSPKASIQIAGKSVPLFIGLKETFQKFLNRTELDEIGAAGNLLYSLTSQTLPFGTPDRNASVDGSLPLLKRTWRVRITDRPQTEAILQKQWETCVDNGKLAISRFHPLVIDGVLFCRTIDEILAIDIETGKRLWVTDAANTRKNKTLDQRKADARIARQMESMLGRVWGNSIFGQLSSDTRNIYAVDVDPTMNHHRYILPGRRGLSDQGISNTLVAIDVQTGEQRWSRSCDNNDKPLFFLGPPLPLDGFLYSLVETQGEVRLVVMSAVSGDIEWSQRIAISEQVVYHYSPQYFHAQMPTMLEGVMVCPTGAGAIVAIEPTTRSLLWAHCYERLGKRHHRVVFVNGIPRNQNSDRIGEELVLHGNHVFSAPVDSHYLYCLDLQTGKEVWKKDFIEGAFLGGVYNDKLLVVGGKKFQTIDISNGEVLNECFLEEALRESGNVVVTGSGFRNEGTYYIAVSSDEIVTLDIDQCKITHKIKSREPLALGNLVAVDDRIFSQSLNGIEAFHQLKAIRKKVELQLKKDPDNLDAMAMQAELLLTEGKINKAIEKFRHIYRTSPTSVNEDRLLDAYCVGLKEAYPVYRDKRSEIEALLHTDQQKADYWYCVILGETEENNLEEAAHACFELAGLSDNSRLTISTDRYHEVQQERFVQAQLASIYEKAKAQLRQKLATTILEKIDSSIQSGEVLSIKGTWNCFASLPPVVDRQDQIAEELWDVDPVFAELALERIIRFGSKSEAATAMVHWAELLRKSKRFDEAAACYREALYRWRKEPLLTDSKQTVLAKFNAMPSNDPVRRLLEMKDSWPEKYSTKPPRNIQRNMVDAGLHGRAILQPVGLVSPIFRGKHIMCSREYIILRDEYARDVWKISLYQKGQSRSQFFGNSSEVRCSTVGHMIFLEFPDQVVAINAWDSKNPKIAWRSNINVLVSMNSPNVGSRFQQKNFTGFTQSRYGHSVNRNRNLGVPGLFIGSQVLAISGREMFALDPYDGTLLWNRRKISPQIDFCTDGNLLLASSPGYQYYNNGRHVKHTAQQITMRLVDGSSYMPSAKKDVKNKKEMAKKAGQFAARLFMSKSPGSSTNTQKVFSLGRNMLVHTRTSRGYSFSLVDNLTQTQIWGPRVFNNQTRWTALGQDYIGTIDSSGNFCLLRIPDGKTLIRRKLKVDGTLQGLYLQNLGDRVGVIISTRARSSTRRPYNRASFNVSEYVQQGRMYILNWDGRSAMKKQPEGFTFKDQGVLLNPPQRLPVVTFVLQTMDYNKKSNPFRAEVQVFDVRTGESVLHRMVSENIRSFDMWSDPERKLIGYQLNRQKFFIQFE